MSSLYEFINNHYRVWDSCELIGTDAIDVTEIWMYHPSQEIVTRQSRVINGHIDAWLNKTSENASDLRSTLLLRMVWVDFEHIKNTQRISPTVLHSLLSHFGIELAHGWNRTCYTGSMCFSDPRGSNQPLVTYSVCNYPNVAIAWSYDVSIGITQGIYFASSSRIPELQNIVQSLAGIAGHPVLPALVFGISLSGLIDQDHKRVKEDVRAVEARTKFHSWTSRNEAPAEGDYIDLSAMTAGASMRIANICQKTQVLYELCDFVKDNLKTVGGTEIPSTSLRLADTDVVNLAEDYTRVLKKRTALQEADAHFFQHRAGIQLQSLSNMIAQGQATINTDTASATRQDSLSLKTLSLVMMFYLPGTFLATLFSVPLMNWNSEKNEPRRFWIYWAVAIPLTLTTLGVWWVWTCILEKKTKLAAQKQC